MAVELVYETHSITEDNEQGIATGWLPGNLSTRGCPVAVLTARRERHIDQPFPGGQSYRDVVAATAEFLDDLAVGWDGQRVLVISHSANRWALHVLLGGASLEDLVNAPFEWQEGWEFLLPVDGRPLAQRVQLEYGSAEPDVRHNGST